MPEENSVDEIMRALASNPPGTFKIFHGKGVGVDLDINQHLQNIGNIKSRIDHAKNANCLTEVISLRLQVLDYWLRLYFVNEAAPNEKRDREFGRLLKQCKGKGLDINISDQLSRFNTDRINAIHGYVIGHIGYQDLTRVVAESDDLGAKLITWILQNSGEVITEIEGRHFNVGDHILHVKSYLDYLQANPIF